VGTHWSSPGQWPRLIGTLCLVRHGRSDPQRQIRRHFAHDHVGRCFRARVSATAERYSLYVTRMIAPQSTDGGARRPGHEDRSSNRRTRMTDGRGTITAGLTVWVWVR
jgi:hypothetical protein